MAASRSSEAMKACVAVLASRKTGLTVKPEDIEEPEPGAYTIDGMPWTQWAEAMSQE